MHVAYCRQSLRIKIIIRGPVLLSCQNILWMFLANNQVIIRYTPSTFRKVTWNLLTWVLRVTFSAKRHAES